MIDMSFVDNQIEFSEIFEHTKFLFCTKNYSLSSLWAITQVKTEI